MCWVKCTHDNLAIFKVSLFVCGAHGAYVDYLHVIPALLGWNILLSLVVYIGDCEDRDYLLEQA